MAVEESYDPGNLFSKLRRKIKKPDPLTVAKEVIEETQIGSEADKLSNREKMQTSWMGGKPDFRGKNVDDQGYKDDTSLGHRVHVYLVDGVIFYVDEKEKKYMVNKYD